MAELENPTWNAPPSVRPSDFCGDYYHEWVVCYAIGGLKAETNDLENLLHMSLDYLRKGVEIIYALLGHQGCLLSELGGHASPEMLELVDKCQGSVDEAEKFLRELKNFKPV